MYTLAAQRHEPLPVAQFAKFAQFPGGDEILFETDPHYTVFPAVEFRRWNTECVAIGYVR